MRLFGLLGLSVGLVLTGCQPNQSAEEYFELAQSHYEQQEYQKALLELKMSVKLDPEHSAYRALLGRTWLALGEPVACVEQLNRAQRLGNQADELIVDLAQCHLDQRQYRAVLELEFDQVAKTTSQRVAELYALKAQAHMGQGDFDKAKLVLNQGFEVADEHPSLMIAQTLWFMHQKKLDKAQAWVDDMLALVPQHPLVWGLQADLFRFLNNSSQSELAYSKALEYATHVRDQVNYRVYRSLVRLYQKNIKGAQEDLHWLDKHKPGLNVSEYLRGLIALSTHDYQKAIDAFQKNVRVDNTLVYANYFLGLSYFLHQNYNTAREYLTVFHQYDDTNASSQKLMALIEIKLNELSRAKSRLINEIKKHSNDAQLYQWLGEIYVKEGDVFKASEVFQKTVSLMPSQQHHFNLGVAQLEMGDEQGARWAFDQVLESHPDHQQALLMAFIVEYKANDMDKARTFAQQIIQAKPSEPLGYNLMAMCAHAQGNIPGAMNWYDNALEKDGHDPNAHNALAAMAMLRQEYRQAQSHYERIVEAYPHTGTWMKLAQLSTLAKFGDDKTKYYLGKAIEYDPYELNAYLNLAKMTLSSRPDKSLLILNRVPDNLQVHEDYYATKGLVYMAQNQPILADRQFRAISDGQHQLYHELGLVLSQHHHDWTMAATHAQALMALSHHENWVLAYAVASAKLNEFEKAISSLHSYYDQQPNSKVGLLLGDYLMRESRWEEAAIVYEDLREQLPDNPILLNNLAWCLKDKEPSRAHAILEMVVAKHPDFTQARQSLEAIEQSSLS